METIALGDVDGDGDLDLASGSGFASSTDRVAWYENTDGAGTFGPQRVIGTDPANPHHVDFADFDGDGDLDILVAAGEFGQEQEVSWFENRDGLGTFGDRRIVDELPEEGQFVVAADLDLDSDLDLVYGFGARVVWRENQLVSPLRPELEIAGACPGTVTLTANGLTPDGNVAFMLAPDPGLSLVPIGACAGAAIDLDAPAAAAFVSADGAGELSIERELPSDLCDRWTQLIDLATCVTSPARALPGETPRAVGRRP